MDMVNSFGAIFFGRRVTTWERRPIGIFFRATRHPQFTKRSLHLSPILPRILHRLPRPLPALPAGLYLLQLTHS